MDERRTWTEEYTVDGASLQASIGDLIREGKARRILIKDSQGKTLLKVPLWLGAAALLKNPKILLLGAFLSRDDPLTLVVEKEEAVSEPLPENESVGAAARGTR